MSNILKIKHGNSPPQSENLENYELGYSISDKGLYTKDENNEIVHLNKTLSYEDIFNLLYPINSIYFTADKNFNPNEVEGWVGTWEKISGYYLYLDEENTGDTAGSLQNPLGLEIEDHILSEGNMPAHTHTLNNIIVNGASAGTPSGSIRGTANASGSHSHSDTFSISEAGNHRHGIPTVITTTTSGRVPSGNELQWRAWSDLQTDSGGAHTHTLTGSVSSANIDVSISGSSFNFSGNSLSEHTHTASGSIDTSGSNMPVEHNVTTNLDLPRFNILCWKRIS